MVVVIPHAAMYTSITYLSVSLNTQCEGQDATRTLWLWTHPADTENILEQFKQHLSTDVIVKGINTSIITASSIPYYPLLLLLLLSLSLA